jgi:hypothetical protein
MDYHQLTNQKCTAPNVYEKHATCVMTKGGPWRVLFLIHSSIKNTQKPDSHGNSAMSVETG